MERKLKKCPYCGKEILRVAKKCRYCGMWIDGDDAHMMKCPSCGERIDRNSKTCPYCCEPISTQGPETLAETGASTVPAENAAGAVSSKDYTEAAPSAEETVGAASSVDNPGTAASSAGNATGAAAPAAEETAPAAATPAVSDGLDEQDGNVPMLKIFKIAVIVVLILVVGGVVWSHFKYGKNKGTVSDTAAVDPDTAAYDDDTATADQSASEGDDQVLKLAEQVYKKCYYDRYNDGEAFSTFPFGYQVSPDGKFLYVVTNVGASGSGWMTEYQLQRYNIDTGELRFITDCAGIIMDDDGITVAKARALNEETAQSEAELIYRVHDQRYSWNGKADLSSDGKEYNTDRFDKQYNVGEYTYVSGVQRFPQSFIDASMK